MTQDSTEKERTEQVREEFHAWCRRRALDVSTKKDARGRNTYKHDAVSLAWLAWKEQEEAYRAIEAARRAPVVPHGWKLVPEFPTQEMCDAAKYKVHAGLSVFKWADGYYAMLAAAPEPQEKQG